MQDPTTFARYREVLKSFLDGPGSAEALLADLDIAALAVGDRIEASALDTLRATIASRVDAIEGAIPTTAACAATGSEQTP